MNFIDRIFNKKPEAGNWNHLQFQRFSKGEFKNKALVSAKKSGEKYTISTSFEFGNELVLVVAEKAGNEKILVTGAIVSTNDLTGEVDFKEKKQFQGVKRYIIEKEMTGKEIAALVNKFPKAFFGLSFKTSKDNTELKIKPKAPTSGKPSAPKEDAEAQKPNFCKLVTNDAGLGKSFVFDISDFKAANISHTFVINEIKIPEELKKTNDFAKMREGAKRKGKIIREIEFDGKKMKKEAEFEA